MLSWIFNHEVFYIIKISLSIFTGLGLVGGSYFLFSPETNTPDGKDFRIKSIKFGAISCTLSFSLLLGWYYADENNLFSYFEEEKFGTPAYLVERRKANKEEEKIKEAEKREKVRQLQKEREEKRDGQRKAKEKEDNKEESKSETS